MLGEVLDKQPGVGLVGPRLEWPNGDLQASCFRAISPASEFLAAAKTGPLSRLLPGREVLLPESQISGVDSSPASAAAGRAIEWISFACVLIRRDVIAAIGPMDEGFFMYFEDVDYARRARDAGWQIAYAPTARVVHLRGGARPNRSRSESSVGGPITTTGPRTAISPNTTDAPVRVARTSAGRWADPSRSAAKCWETSRHTRRVTKRPTSGREQCADLHDRRRRRQTGPRKASETANPQAKSRSAVSIRRAAFRRGPGRESPRSEQSLPSRL